MRRLEGKTAFITGAARGQGRSHALRLAQEGARIIAVDICEQVPGVAYEMATYDDLCETQKLVEEADGQILIDKADVRQLAELESMVARGLDRFGSVDIVCANAGISSYGKTWELSESAWQDTIDVNLTGVWHTIRATVPPMIDAGRGGSIIITSSSAALVGSRRCRTTPPPRQGCWASRAHSPRNSVSITSGLTPSTQPASILTWRSTIMRSVFSCPISKIRLEMTRPGYSAQ